MQQPATDARSSSWSSSPKSPLPSGQPASPPSIGIPAGGVGAESDRIDKSAVATGALGASARGNDRVGPISTGDDEGFRGPALPVPIERATWPGRFGDDVLAERERASL